MMYVSMEGAWKGLTIAILILVNVDVNESATFENVSVALSSVDGKASESLVVVSDNHLSRHVNRQIEGRPAEVVKIEKQNVPILYEGSITDLLEVKHLYLTGNGIKEVRPGAFGNLPKLSELSLSDNLLTEIRNGVFDNLPFETLYLENNRIARIEDKAFNHLRMAYLFIDNNRISAWKSDWFSGTPLTGISMSNNFIEALPAASFQHLWQFAVRGYGFTLAYVILNDNRIRSIDPDAFDGIQEVSYLSLQNNLLGHLEPGLFDSVEELRVLELNNNQIDEIYYETFRKTKLTELRLNTNRLSCISVDVFDVTSLEVLYVDGNPLTCTCFESWKSWNKTGKRLRIDSFDGLEEKCVGKSKADVARFSLYTFLCMLLMSVIPK